MKSAELKELSTPIETQVAVLIETVNNLKEKQAKESAEVVERQLVHHENVKRVGNDINMLRLEFKDMSSNVTHIMTEQKDLKKVITNNTDAFIEMKDLVHKFITERETTKSNISTFGKLVLWIGSFSAMCYAGFQVMAHWIKG